MAPEPFLTLPIRSCRDLVHVRHRARQIAQLLHFDPREVIGIAAGAFVVAERAKTLLRRGHLCFAIVEGHLRLFAKAASESRSQPHDLLVLSKPIPPGETRLAAEDLHWLVRQVQLLAPTTLQEEMAQQNREVLELLTVLRGCATPSETSVKPSAA